MKNFFRFAAIAATMLTLCVACKKAGDQGTKEPLSIDGKQVSFTLSMPGMGDVPSVFDFGVKKNGILTMAYDASIMGITGLYLEYMAMDYTIEPTSATSGTITISADGETSTITYEDLTAESVKLSNDSPFGLSKCEATILKEKAEIKTMEELGDIFGEEE